MKKYLLLNLFMLLSLCHSIGQITYTNASFPVAGDILKISTAVDSLRTIAAPSATAQSWDFTNLIEVNLTVDTIEGALAGSAAGMFPSADIIQPFINNIGGDAYVDVTTNEVTRIGGGVEIFGLSFVAPYVDPHITQTASITYPSSESDDYKWAYSTHVDSVPFLRQLLDSLLGSFSPDSIRIAIEGEETRDIDAFGTCTMPDSVYSVLRQKVVTDVAIEIEIYVTFGPFGSWQPVTSYLTGALPFPTESRIVRYDFLAEGIKQPVASLTMDSSETAVANTQYYRRDTTVNIRHIEDELDVAIFPNPAKESIHIQVMSEDMPVEGYNLQLVDMLGRVSFVERAIRDENHEIKVDAIAAGHYVVILREGSGKILKREQVEIIR